MWIAAATCARCRTVVASASLASFLALVPLALAGGGVDRKAPSVPTNLRVTAVTASSITLAWDTAKDNKGGAQLSGYGLYRNGVAVGTATATTYSFVNLSCGTSSALGVDAYDITGNRSSTAVVTASTSPCTTSSSSDTSPPTAPSKVTVSGATGASITLTWSASTDNVGVAGYGTYQGLARVGTTSQTSYAFSGLTCATTYSLGVDSYDAAGNRSSVVAVTASTAACGDTSAPTAPTALTETAETSSSISLSWKPSFDNVGVVGYGEYRNGTRVATSTTTTATLSSLSCGSSYTVGVDAVDAAGNRSAVTSIAASTAPCATTQPSAPLGVSGSWTLAFDDEFNGTALDRSRWTTLDGSQMNNVTTYDKNVSVSGGNVILTLASSTSGAEIDSAPYDGAGAHGYLLPVRGYAEARIRFPGSGTTIYNWPAWWASGPNWPAAGENDIAEGLGTMTVNYHSPSGSHNYGTIPGTWSDAFHVYGLHRLPDHCDVYYDGIPVASYPTDDNGSGEALLINIGAGNTRQVPSQLLVDWVRAWEPAL